MLEPWDPRDPRLCGLEAAEYLLHPISVRNFEDDFFEKQPLHIQRNNANYNKTLYMKTDIEDAIRDQKLHFCTDLMVVSCGDGDQKTWPTAEERVLVDESVWKEYKERKCGFKVLNPQKHSDSVWRLLWGLEKHFRCQCSSHALLTPAGCGKISKPQFEDVDIFLLQSEGEMHWTVHRPPDENQLLSRFPSREFKQTELEELGDPELAIKLTAGQALYIPRGFVHQGMASENSHSLHLTVTANQLNTYVDLLCTIMPKVVARAADTNIEFRRALPRDLYDQLGVINDDSRPRARRDEILSSIKNLATRAFAQADSIATIDCGVDSFAADKFIATRVPPPPIVSQQPNGEVIGLADQSGFEENGHCGKEFTKDSEIRFISKHIARLVIEGEVPMIVHSGENSRVPGEEDKKSIEIGHEYVGPLRQLIQAFPRWTKISDLKMSYHDVDASTDDEERDGDDQERVVKDQERMVTLARILDDRGLLYLKTQNVERA